MKSCYTTLKDTFQMYYASLVEIDFAQISRENSNSYCFPVCIVNLFFLISSYLILYFEQVCFKRKIFCFRIKWNLLYHQWGMDIQKFWLWKYYSLMFSFILELDQESLFNHLELYFRKFGSKPCCFTDIRQYTKLLDKEYRKKVCLTYLFRFQPSLAVFFIKPWRKWTSDLQ